MGGYAKSLRTKKEVFGKRAKGYCIICSKYDLLSADHVPPKSCVKIQGKVQDVILQTLMPQANEKKIVVQGGVKFNSICDECNNTLLGTTYDPALINFVEKAFEQIKQRSGRIALASYFTISIQSNRVARALVGHLLAALAVQQTSQAATTLGAGDSLRRYLLDPAQSFPGDWRIYCWPYLGRQQIIIKHFMHADFSAPAPNNSLYGHVIKFFPLGFWFVHNQPKECRIYAYELTPSASIGLNGNENIYFDLANIPDLGFPEHPVGSQAMLFSDLHTSVATPK